MPVEQRAHETETEIALQREQRDQIEACYAPLLAEFDKVKAEGMKTESTFPNRRAGLLPVTSPYLCAADEKTLEAHKLKQEVGSLGAAIRKSGRFCGAAVI